MRDEVVRVVETYIDAVRRNDAPAAPLADDMVGIFPMSTFQGAAAFRAGIDPFARLAKSIHIAKMLADDEHCILLLEVESDFGTIAIAEHIHVVNGKIAFVRGYYDPRPILAGMKH